MWQNFTSELQLRSHVFLKNKILRNAVGYLHGIMYWIGMGALFAPSCIELAISALYASCFLKTKMSVRAGLLGHYLRMHRRYERMQECIVLNVIDPNIASEIRSATCTKDPLGVRCDFPRHVQRSRIDEISRCWRMANDFRIRIVRVGHSLYAGPIGKMRPLSVDGMTMWSRPELRSHPERKVVSTRIQLLDDHGPMRVDKRMYPGARFEFSMRGSLFEQMCHSCMRTQLVRDAEERYLGGYPTNKGAMARFLKSYVRLSVCMVVFFGGFIAYTDSPILERSAFALTFGIVAAESWESTCGEASSHAVGESRDSVWNRDRDQWRRFFERRLPGSTDMSAKNGCWLRSRGRGSHDVGPVRVDELAVLHDVFVGDDWALLREGGESFVAKVNWQGGASLCLGPWRSVEDKCIEDRDCCLDSEWCADAQKGVPVALASAQFVVGCKES